MLLLLKPGLACSDLPAALLSLRAPVSSQQRIFGIFVETWGQVVIVVQRAPCYESPGTASLSRQSQGCPHSPACSAEAAARIKPRLCRALMFPGGRSSNGAVECCFYTRFISTVNTPPQSCSPSMPCMAMSARKARLLLLQVRADTHLQRALQTSAHPGSPRRAQLRFPAKGGRRRGRGLAL